MMVLLKDLFYGSGGELKVSLYNMIIKGLRRREITGKRIRINYVYPLRDTKYICCRCHRKIKGLIVDFPEDIDVFGFRYHYFIPMVACHLCHDPLKLP